MASRQSEHRVGWVAVVLAACAAGILAAVIWLPSMAPRDRALIWDGITIAAALLSSALILWARRVGRAWPSSGYYALGMLAVAIVAVVFLVREMNRLDFYQPSLSDLGFLGVTLLMVLPIRSEFRRHFDPEDRREISIDVVLISAALAGLAYLAILAPDASSVEMVSAAVFAASAAVAFTTYGALMLRAPSPAHISLFVVFAALSAATVVVAGSLIDGTYEADQPGLALVFSVGGLALAGIVTLVPARASAPRPQDASHRWGRPLLTSISVATACLALAAIAVAGLDEQVTGTQAVVLIALLAAGIAVRILVNQVRTTKTRRELSSALAQKEAALRETDLALEQVRTANVGLRESEEHLRSVFEAAVDGIIELDGSDTILRANDAFCQMVRLPRDLVEGRPWTSVAAAVDGADESFASLPSTGQGVLQREGHPLYLESRLSEIPSTPPKRLLLVRDTTAARVADQTIRSLFQFLQDRDEDRTRIMRRTNSAIEGERNRIARDLHDGPVQGVSAASLSLEAALLMIKAGEVDEGLDILAKVRIELSEEADNLRRLMSGLRPPLLEERGLVPAIRETLSKFGHDQEIETEFAGKVRVEVPSDLETLAYRIVQEALSNAGKHAKATRIQVSIEAEAGQLRLEVIDDGVGFDSGQARDYLRQGRVGLASMRERVELANGTFMVHSTPGRGTTILATLPLDPARTSREIAV